MKWVSALSEKAVLTEAVAECAATVKAGLEGGTPDLVVAFVSPHHATGYDAVPDLLRHGLGGGRLLGCSADGVIGAGREVERRPGLAVSAAVLPGVKLAPFHVEDSNLPDEYAAPSAWESLAGAPTDADPVFLIVADPFTVRGEALLMGLDYAYPRSAKIGGLASGAHQPGGNALFLGGGTHRAGAVGVALSGNIAVDTIVAQGCRPVGQPMHVTACHANYLLEVDGQQPLKALRELYATLSEDDQRLARQSLFLGIVMDEMNDSLRQGDFLIRNILGADQEHGALAVGEVLKEGQTVQFHLRDATTSAADLDVMLTRYAASRTNGSGQGALLFQCLGRGAYLYGRPDHDTDMFRTKVSDMPLAGFFCNGEIGQVGGTTYLHGYTSSFGIFRPKRDI
jgi:small ligand-binding sensory domain FIST